MTVTAFLKHPVAAFEPWKKVYDALGTVRLEKYGMSSASVHRVVGEPNTIVITHTFPDQPTMMAFFESTDLRDAMQNAGVTGAPEIWFTEDVEQTTH